MEQERKNNKDNKSRVSKDTEWSQLIEEFDINEESAKNEISLLFFKIRLDNRFEVYEPLDALLSTMKNLIFSY
ncbi:MAG: hypothetical protein ACTSQG_02470 [Promethearchaeota archaeon]